jgi:pimeloyl-ACP methyl ester carboxylesterase
MRKPMANEVFEEGVVEVATVEDAGHYVAEENPEGFVRVVLDFLRKGNL